MHPVRTDLADEAAGRLGGDALRLKGLTLRRETLGGAPLLALEIRDPETAEKLGKPPGRYFTLELPAPLSRASERFGAACSAVAEMIRRCGVPEEGGILVAALGNPDITPDALGSLAASSILVTRHLKQNEPERFPQFCSLALCRPGVLGTSGIESAAQIKILCTEIQPQLVVAIDALAGSEADTLCRSVQVSNAGISPGSGVGNDREELSMAALGVPVLSIGIPTVIDAGFLGEGALRGMFVTPRDIDSLVRRGARLIAYALNLALHHGLSVTDIDTLIG